MTILGNVFINPATARQVFMPGNPIEQCRDALTAGVTESVIARLITAYPSDPEIAGDIAQDAEFQRRVQALAAHTADMLGRIQAGGAA